MKHYPCECLCLGRGSLIGSLETSLLLSSVVAEVPGLSEAIELWTNQGLKDLKDLKKIDFNPLWTKIPSFDYQNWRKLKVKEDRWMWVRLENWRLMNLYGEKKTRRRSAVKWRRGGGENWKERVLWPFVCRYWSRIWEIELKSGGIWFWNFALFIYLLFLFEKPKRKPISPLFWLLSFD